MRIFSLAFLLLSLFFLNNLVFAEQLIDFSIVTNPVAEGESTEIEFNINNKNNVELAIYGYTSKGFMEIFDEISDSWVLATNATADTKVINKTKVRIKDVSNEPVSVYFILVDPKGLHSYKTIDKKIWVGNYNKEYIDVLNETMEITASTSSSIFLFDKYKNMPSEDISKKPIFSNWPSYLAFALIAIAFLAISVLVIILLKYSNAPTEEVDTSLHCNDNYICSIVDTWQGDK